MEIIRLIFMLSLSFFFTYEVGHSLVRMSCLAQFYDVAFKDMTRFIHISEEKPTVNTERCSYEIEIAAPAIYEFKSKYYEQSVVDFELKLSQGFLNK